MTEDVMEVEMRALVDHDAEAEAERWAVTDERSAEYALLRIRQARLDAERRTEHAREAIAAHEARIAELREHVAAAEREAQGTADHFTALLVAWHRRRYAEDPRCKSIKLAGGVLRSRAGRDRVEVDEPLAVVGWAAAVGSDAAEYVPKVNKAALLRWIKDTGEVPEGARLVRATEDDRTFEVVT